MSLGGERRTGLILAGGGARGACQVGVLQVVADTLAVRSENPFPILVGTSAGALNAAVPGCGALDSGRAVERLAAVWSGLETAMIYRSDWGGATRQAARFGLQTLFGAWRQESLALLDKAPLRALLSRELDFSGITAALRQRALRAVAVTAFGYASGQAMTFYQSHGALDPWVRHRRVGVPARLAVDHLLASTAIPLFFPPVKVGREYLGDGSIRQTGAHQSGAAPGRRSHPGARARRARRSRAWPTGPTADGGADRRSSAQQHLCRCAGQRHRNPAPPQPAKQSAASGGAGRRSPVPAGGDAGDLVQPGAGGHRHPPAQAPAAGVAAVAAGAG